ncbi:MAG: hypothetical protein EDS66_09730 [Planctomycetota bacterium]|nr:MAG: hypothetical protein EDS66_09730 [Planctomycetota bacterium]MCQ3921098.1 hypothetical protein [Planctomycetota bacterium]
MPGRRNPKVRKPGKPRQIRHPQLEPFRNRKGGSACGAGIRDPFPIKNRPARFGFAVRGSTGSRRCGSTRSRR